MDTNEIKERNKTELDRGKIRQLPVLERIPVWIAGWRDSRRGLPVQNETGLWTSPFLKREVDAYEERASKIWGRRQLESETDFAHMEELMNDLQADGQSLRHFREAYEREKGQSENQTVFRKRGEESLTETQVLNRRHAERDKQLAPLRARVENMEARIKTNWDALSQLCGVLEEAEHTTTMVCHRFEDHLRQRADVYWNAATRRCPGKDGRPITPTLMIQIQSERLYQDAHEDLLRRAHQMLAELQEKEDQTC